MASDLVEYLQHVLHEGDGVWLNIHHLRHGIIPGNAHQSIRLAVQDVNYWVAHGTDVWVAQGVYINPGKQYAGCPYPSAIRQGPNLSMCRCLYLDIDVKDGAYETPEAARAALDRMVELTALPHPSMIVASGTGGLHVYWAMADLFEPSVFRRYAPKLVAAAEFGGLIFDAACTNDSVRLLRPPGTWNYKHEPAAPVMLVHKGERIDNAAMWAALDKFAPSVTIKSKSFAADEGDEWAIPSGGKHYSPADIDAVAKECPFIRDTLADGGASLTGEPQWKLVTNLASFCIDGRATVHRLIEKNPYYVEADANLKFDQTEEQKKNNPAIGPFKCGKIKSYGIPHCSTCPHLQKDTSPLMLAPRPINGHAYLSQPGDDLPSPYYRGKDDWIYIDRPDDGGKGGPEPVCVFSYPILPGSGFIEAFNPSRLVFETKEADGTVVKKTFPSTFVRDRTTFYDALLKEALPSEVNVDDTRKFMNAYLTKLRRSAETAVSVPAFGWVTDSKGEQGFAFGSKFFTPSGEGLAASPPSGVSEFSPKGSIDPWQALAKVIVIKERPDLAVGVAAAFAAPLLKILGREGLLMGIWSSASGIGKSTALQLGQAVWGKPLLGGMSDTSNYTVKKCSELKHLPAYYDEIKGEKQIATMCDLVFQLTRGRDKGRLKRNSEMMDTVSFEALLIYASNASIMAEVRQHHKGTDADMLRIFEMRAIVAPNTEKLFVSQVSKLTSALRDNYGVVGLQYAEFLGKNHAFLVEALNKVQDKLQDELNASQEQRYWLAAITSIYVAAQVINYLGICQFPIQEMYDYMIREYNYLLGELRDNSSDYSNETTLISTIGNLISEKRMKNTIFLNKSWTKKSRPPRDYAEVLNYENEKYWTQLEIQVSGDPLMLRISDTALGVWCQKHKHPKSALINAMRKLLDAKLSLVTIGSGTRYAGGPEHCWVINAKGTCIEDYLEHAIHHTFLPEK